MGNKYSISEFTKNVYSLILTKLFFNQARLIRRPVYIRGKKSLVGGTNLTLGRFCRFDLDGNKKTLFIGDDCEFGDMTHIVALNNVQIGNNVLIASKVFISDTSHGAYKGIDQDLPSIPPNKRKIVSSDVIIGNNVWIGENVVILAGVHIGDGCIIGANSVVTKDIEKNCIVAGAPTTVIKQFNCQEKKWERT